MMKSDSNYDIENQVVNSLYDSMLEETNNNTNNNDNNNNNNTENNNKQKCTDICKYLLKCICNPTNWLKSCFAIGFILIVLVIVYAVVKIEK